MYRFFLIFIAVSIFAGCSASMEDCICTTEFRMITVSVADQNNNPVKLDSTNVTNLRNGKNYEFQEEVYPGSEGIYLVMTDSYVNEISTGGDEIVFKGFLDTKVAGASFIISTDECKCHVAKTAGPDTLYMTL